MARLTAEERADVRWCVDSFESYKATSDTTRDLLDSLDEAEFVIGELNESNANLASALTVSEAEIARLRMALVNIRRSATFAEMKRHADRALEVDVQPIDTVCEWCGGTDIKAVRQGPYTHHMCQKPGCAHEWD